MERQNQRPGFTLVELLVTVTVLAILAALVLVALASATQSAKEARTRATIAKINAVVMAKWESYKTRRASVRMFLKEDGSQDLNGNGTKTDQYSPVQLARYRIDAIRELMRMELPDRFSDITDDPVTPAAIGGNLPKMRRPSVSESYKRKMPASPSTQYQGAKCLYLIVTTGGGDPDIMEQFSPSEIGTDTDGMRYFKDGWEQPISFLRWAPGFFSSLQNWDLTTNLPKDHDPLDPTKAYVPTGSDPFAAAGVYPPLYPLIYSPGPDGEYEVNTAGSHRYATVNNHPYADHGGGLIGDWHDANGDGVDGRADNITNHD